MRIRGTTRLPALLVVALLVPACTRPPEPSIEAMRTEARALVAADRPHARHLYARVRRRATGAGDHLARVEAELFFRGGDPAWVDVLDPDAGEGAYLQLVDLDLFSKLITALYSVGVVVMFGALGGAVTGLLLQSSGWDRQVAETELGICGGVGAAGLAMLVAGFVLDFDSAAQRHHWVESLRPPGALW